MTTPHTTTTILCGDFNARVGPHSGDTRFNHRGHLFWNWMQSHDLILWNSRLTPGQPTYYAYQGTSIIDYFISNNELQQPSLLICDDLSLSSNHKFMTFRFDYSNLPSSFDGHLPQQRKQWRLGRLKQKVKFDEYRSTFTQQLHQLHLQSPLLTPSQSLHDRSAACTYIDQLSTDLCRSIHNSLDLVCGQQQQPTEFHYLKDFWTPAMSAAFDRKEYFYRKWHKAQGLNCLTFWLKHQEATAALRRLVSQRRKETWRHFCDQMGQGEYTKAISRFSRIRKNRAVKPTFSTDGSSPQNSADVMAQHLERTFSGDLLPTTPVHPIDLDSPNSSTPFDCDSSPITIDTVSEAFQQMPKKKAPGVDHLTIELLSPIQDLLAPVLTQLFNLCWQWSYTPLSFPVAQVVPIHKKGISTDPSNYRPISLTTTFRKLLEKCIYADLLSYSPILDIAQGGFREARSSLDQALCLVEICSILRRKHHVTPTLAFLDIKSAYDTVDRDYVWHTLQNYLPPALLGLLRSLFDDVHIEVLLQNTSSTRFSPRTGVLQGSILSPFLYSIYINQLPALLRDSPLDPTLGEDTVRLFPSLTCLLYADDVVLIAAPEKLNALLLVCEDHSRSLGYRWNPSKCVIVAPLTADTQIYSLYSTPLPRESSFSYLGIPIQPGGFLDPAVLVQNNINKAKKTMNQLTSIGVNPHGFDRLLSVRFYVQMVRAQMEYGLAISVLNKGLLKQLESCQNECIRRIFGGSTRSSVKVMLHLLKQPSMSNRVDILQARFLLRSFNLPDDTLLASLLPYLQGSASHSQWYKLTKGSLWKRCTPVIDDLDRRSFNALRYQFLVDSYTSLCEGPSSKLLSACRPTISIDPITWLPMTRSERSRALRWRLGWLPGSKPKPCIYHPDSTFTREHTVQCLHIHRRLQLPHTIQDPLSFILNQLPCKKPRTPQASSVWFVRWPAVCSILHEMDYLFHEQIPPDPVHPGAKLVDWLSS